MKVTLKSVTGAVHRFFCIKPLRRLSYIALLVLIALIGHLASGRDRRTMVFYTRQSTGHWIEERLVPREVVLEASLARYVEEVLLGPFSVDAVPLFDSETRLRTAMVRGDIAYIDLSEGAVFPSHGGPTTEEGLEILRQGILRNFPAINAVYIFIAGNVPFGKNLFSTIQEEGEK